MKCSPTTCRLPTSCTRTLLSSTRVWPSTMGLRVWKEWRCAKCHCQRQSSRWLADHGQYLKSHGQRNDDLNHHSRRLGVGAHPRDTPPKPPANVEAIEPDIVGRRRSASNWPTSHVGKLCSCHRLIDPPGFALENFDVIGGWRDHYRAPRVNLA